MWSYHNVNDPACEAGLCGCEPHRPPQILEDTAKWLAIRFEPGGVVEIRQGFESSIFLQIWIVRQIGMAADF